MDLIVSSNTTDTVFATVLITMVLIESYFVHDFEKFILVKKILCQSGNLQMMHISRSLDLIKAEISHALFDGPFTINKFCNNNSSLWDIWPSYYCLTAL
ncbi:hypothetical protein KUTeg_016995 [Tegillarca granosa]|uniref:Uncharacterized protein n=1 Tax=Tegillarca granosa TaxID=220873 RepID=A0ABQ9ESS0_TEGGR|nr:hypothetical protein KUTeg_016995 [Tegillarca granosa]